jgi:hypothetical protein
MRIATVPSKRRRDLTIIGILLIGIPLVVFASYQAYQLITRASAEAQPRNVVISKLTTSAVTVSWVTDVQSFGSVIPIQNGIEKSPIVDTKRGNRRRYTHHIDIEDLDPNTQYEFVIVSDREKYRSEGNKNFAFKTAPITETSATPNPIHGGIKGVVGDDVIIYALLKDKSAYPVSTTIPTGGNWVIDLSAFRSIANKTPIVVTNSTNIVLVAISGPNKGAVQEGTYSELFDSSGKLKDVYALTIGDNSSLYNDFPPVSMLEAFVAEPEEPTQPTTPTTPTTPPAQETDDTPTGNTGRVFRIVHNLQWIDMVTGDGSAVSGVSGAASVQTTNLTDTGFTVLWISENKEKGHINYGTSRDSLSSQATDERDGLTTKSNYYIHSVVLSRLQPDTEYFFEIESGDNKYDNGGNKYVVKTFSTLTSPPPFESVTGVIDGMPEHKEVVVTVHIKDEDGAGSKGESLKLSTLVDENGKWILSIAESRVQDGTSYFEYTSEDSLNVNLVTTFSASTHTEKMQGISDRDVEISVEGNSSSGVGYTRVELLQNYGILGHSTGVNPDLVVTPDDSEYEVDSGIETPKTGILDNVVYLILLSFALISIGVVTYKGSVTRQRKGGKMIRAL